MRGRAALRTLAVGFCARPAKALRHASHGLIVLVLGIPACATAQCDCAAAEANVRLVRRSVEEGYNARNPAIFDSVYHPDAVVWNNGVRLDDGPILDGFRRDLVAYDQQFSVWSIAVNDIFGTADRVAVRWTFHGRLRSNGRDVTQTGNWIGRIVNGRVVEVWESTVDAAAPAPPPQARDTLLMHGAHDDHARVPTTGRSTSERHPRAAGSVPLRFVP
ncbi:MAG TPA: nuclear transport factor 2 family protein [Longimicrobiales bacterium]